MKIPNILMIVTDQQRRDTIGAYGSQICKTPHVDRLAAQGMAFDYAFTPCGLCTPVRASMLTGVYPHTHEVLTNNVLHPIRTELQPEQDRMVRGLRGAGYRLGYVGKWHVNSKKTPVDFGFEKFVSLSDYESYRAEIGVSFTPAHRNYIVPTSGVDPVALDDCRQAFLADQTIGLINEFAEDEEHPFFIRLDFHGPHAPNVIPEPYASMYAPGDIPPHANWDDPLIDKPAVQRIKRQHWGTEDMQWADWQQLVAHYYGEISLIDAQVGRVLNAVDEAGIAEDTLIMYFTDHGDTMGAHKIWNKDYTMYDEIYRIPFIVSWPGVTQPGSRCDTYIQHGIDLLPTFFDIAGIDLPDGLHGQSFEPLLRGETQARPREAFSEFHGCHMGMYTLRMLQTDRFKYIFHTNDVDELYDHDNDPFELHNLAQDPAYAAELHQLRLRMVEWMAKTDDHLYNEWIVYWMTGDMDQAIQAPGRTNQPW